jgi:hypothetical protein
MKTVLTIALIAMLLLATGTAHADAIDVCKQRFRAGELQPGDEIGACYAKATKNRCDGSLDGADAQACLDWVETLHWSTDCRHGWIRKEFKAELMPVEITDTSVRITYDELRKLACTRFG